MCRSTHASGICERVKNTEGCWKATDLDRFSKQTVSVTAGVQNTTPLFAQPDGDILLRIELDHLQGVQSHIGNQRDVVRLAHLVSHSHIVIANHLHQG